MVPLIKIILKFLEWAGSLAKVRVVKEMCEKRAGEIFASGKDKNLHHAPVGVLNFVW